MHARPAGRLARGAGFLKEPVSLSRKARGRAAQQPYSAAGPPAGRGADILFIQPENGSKI
ncbi:MAG: hypothetical protein DBY09_05475 [Selenomonadales bacterium]|nr:MAG: hypothetical protein DBY09_05475 [Selenomonadales bacterium]